MPSLSHRQNTFLQSESGYPVHIQSAALTLSFIDTESLKTHVMFLSALKC